MGGTAGRAAAPGGRARRSGAAGAAVRAPARAHYEASGVRSDRVRRKPEGAMARIVIERMSHDDVPSVMAVDHLCFPTPWSENAYRSEMGNVSAYYLVARL